MRKTIRQSPDLSPDPESLRIREQAKELEKESMRHYVRATLQSRRAEEILRRNNIAGSIIGGRDHK